MARLAGLALFPMFAWLTVAQTEAPVIRVNTRLVQVSVVVHDKQGPVTGLTKDDFALTEHGKPRPISFFSVESAKAVAPTPGPLPPNIFSNRDGKFSKPTTATVVLLDGLNTSLPDQAYARQQLIKLIRELNPEDRVALYTLGRSLRVLQDFTNDPEQLRRRLAKYRGTSTSDLAATETDPAITGDAQLDLFLAEADAVAGDQAQVNRTLRTFDALEAIADHLARIPGRKNLIWLSAAFPLSIGYDAPATFGDPKREHRTFNEERQRAVRALNNANVAIYPVDARGLVSVPAQVTAQAPPRPGPFRAPTSMIPTGLDTMGELASSTGGRAFYNTNDLTGAVRAAVADAAVSYTLGFYPDESSLDGKFHELKVQVKRKGVEVRYRRGYRAFKDEVLGDKERESGIRAALWSPVEATGLSLAGRVERTSKPERNSLEVRLATQVQDLRLEQKDDRWTGKVAVIFVQQDKDSKVLDSTRDSLGLNLTRTTYEKALVQGLNFGRVVKAKDGLAVLRVVLVDYPSGEMGSLIIPLAQVK